VESPGARLNFAGLPDDRDALINFDNCRARKISDIKIVIMPIITMAMIGSVAKLLLASWTAPTITATNPPRVRTAIVVAMAAIDLVKSTVATIGSAAVGLLRLAPQRLQYFSSIGYSVPQLGQNMVREW
jgi:hypothetical protein